MADDIFEKYPPCLWTAKGRTTVEIPVQRISESVETRISPRKRTYKNGAKQDSTGRDYLVWDLEASFLNGLSEEGIAENGHYPEGLNSLCASIDVNATGDLQLPTRGLVRAVFKGYRRVESNGERDFAGISLTFWEDTEDGISVASFAQGSGRATARNTLTLAQRACKASGVWGQDVKDLEGLVTDLESFASAPFDAVDTAVAQARSTAHLVGRVERAFGDAVNTANGELALLMTRPEASLAGRTMRELSDVAQRIVANATGIGDVETVTYARAVSIFDVAAQRGQDAMKLMALNRAIPSQMHIPARTPILVYRA